MTEILKSLMNPGVIWVLIPLAAIIGAMVNKGLKAHYNHQERMAKIENGIDPDKYSEQNSFQKTLQDFIS